MTPALLEVRGLRKTYPGTTALDGVDLDVRAGEVLALLGENGAGKSTLIKILSGVESADRGTIVYDGRPYAPADARAAEALGLSTVFQEINLIPGLPVWENVVLGRERTRFGLLRRAKSRERAVRALRRIGLDLDVEQPLASFPVAVRQLVAVARALDVEARILVLDEPTASLATAEVERLFEVLRGLRTSGLGIVFVSHFLDQVYAIADRIVVLRNGRNAGAGAARAIDRLELVSWMLGRDARAFETSKARADRAPAHAPFVDVRGLGRGATVRSVDLTIARGEVVGLAGLLGSGRTETARLLFGADRAERGSVVVDGENALPLSPCKAVALGFAFSPEDRKREGLILEMTVLENIALALQARRGGWSRLAPIEARALALRYIEALGIKTPSPETPVGALSGGNQQKVLLARWLALSPRLLILDDPTRGIDVGAKLEIAALIDAERCCGASTLVISSEIDEIVRLADRVVVLDGRKTVGVVPTEQGVGAVMRLIAGGGDA